MGQTRLSSIAMISFERSYENRILSFLFFLEKTKSSIFSFLKAWTLGGNYMIPVSRDGIMSRFVEILSVSQNLHKLYPTITCEKFHPSKAGSLICATGIPLCRNEVFPCNRFHRLSGIKSYLTHAYKKILKENVCTDLNKRQVKNCPGLLEWNLSFPWNRRVKSIPAKRVDISSQETGIM